MKILNNHSWRSPQCSFLFIFFLVVMLWSPASSSQCVSTFQLLLSADQHFNADKILPAGNGQFIVCTRKTYPGKTTELFIKMDTLGNIAGVNEYYVEGLAEISSYQLTNNGGLVLVGQNNTTPHTIICLKIAASGQVESCKKFDLVSQESFSLTNIIQDSDGGFIISGTTYPSGYTGTQVFIMRIDEGGNTKWSKSFKPADLPDGDYRNGSGGGMFVKDSIIIFCAGITNDGTHVAENLCLIKLSLTDGSLVSGFEYQQGGFSSPAIYEDLHGGFYVTGIYGHYRAHSAPMVAIRINNNLEILKYYSPGLGGEAFSPTKEGFLAAGFQGLYNGWVPYFINKVALDGTITYSGAFPHSWRDLPPRRTITDVLETGNHIIVAGSKGDSVFVAALDAGNPSNNTCELTPYNEDIFELHYDTIPLTWQSITDVLVQSVQGDVPVAMITSTVEADTICFYSCSHSLPLQLKDFSGTIRDDQVQLHFSFANTTDNTVIGIERSFDGHSFTTVGQVWVNNSDGTQLYHYTDNLNSTAQTVYYRLKLTAPAETPKYSQILSFNLSALDSWSFVLHPNPAKQFCSLSIDAPASEIINIYIKNSIGQSIYAGKKTLLIKGSNNIPLQTQSLLPGIYYVEVITNSQRQIKKLLVF